MNSNKYFASWRMSLKCNFSCHYCSYAVPNSKTKTSNNFELLKQLISILAFIKQQFFGLKKNKSPKITSFKKKNELLKNKFLKLLKLMGFMKSEEKIFLAIKSEIFVPNLIKTLKKTKKNWTVGMTGGEPFIYPDFVQVCKEITRHYNIAIDTNLSIDSKTREFANTIHPKKVDYIFVSTHIQERERIEDVDNLITRVLMLKNKGFNVIVNYVLYPTLVKKFEEDYKYFKFKGIELLVTPFKGEFNDKIYPRSYTKSERKLIYKYDPNVEFYPTNLKGTFCNAGKNLIRIHQNGTITRCSSDEKTIIGNIFEGIKLFKKSFPCLVTKCKCFGYDLIENKN